MLIFSQLPLVAALVLSASQEVEHPFFFLLALVDVERNPLEHAQLCYFIILLRIGRFINLSIHGWIFTKLV
jgi:hypothetical protein